MIGKPFGPGGSEACRLLRDKKNLRTNSPVRTNATSRAETLKAMTSEKDEACAATQLRCTARTEDVCDVRKYLNVSTL